MALEPADILAEVFRETVMDLKQDVDMIRHHNICIYLDRRGADIGRDTLDLCGDLLAERRALNKRAIYITIRHHEFAE